MGGNFEIKAIDDLLSPISEGERAAFKAGDRLTTPMFTGVVNGKNRKEISLVYYLKMSNSELADNSYTDQDVAEGKVSKAELRNLLKQSRDINGNWDAAKLKGLDLGNEKIFAYYLNSYEKNLR